MVLKLIARDIVCLLNELWWSSVENGNLQQNI